MANSTAFVLNKKSQEAFINYYNQTQHTVKDVRSSQRLKFTHVDKAYQREQDESEEHQNAKNQNRRGNLEPLQNAQIPVVMPQVESAVVYQSSVFLSSTPIFGVVANKNFMDEATQMETIVANEQVRGGWTKQLMMFFRDGFKYNFAPIEIDWTNEVTIDLITDSEFDLKQAKPVQSIWEGNALKRLDPYNTFVDPKVAPTEVYCKGEFAGYTENISRMETKQRIAAMSDTVVQNVTEAFNSSVLTNPSQVSEDTLHSYFVPDINPDLDSEDVYGNDMNWLSWAGLEGNKNKGKPIEYKNAYDWTVLYCKILPSEFNLNVPAPNTPQIWKLIIINHQVIIHAERQTNAHNFLPILIGQPYEDGLRYQTKSLADNAEGFQQLSSSLMQSILDSRRKAISDRTIFDPSRIASAHINSKNPSAKIPIRPSAYGKKVSDAVYAFPYREDQGGFSMAQIKDLIGLANTLSGQNPARQGQFVKGNKTREEFSDVMNNANGRDQLTSILLEAQVFVPMKHIIKTNILQYQGNTVLYNEKEEKDIQISPQTLRKAVLEFKISDGLVPADKLIESDVLMVAMQVIGSSQQIAGDYNVGELFSYLMQTKGARIKDFEKSKEQRMYEQAMNQYQQQVMMAIEKGIDLTQLPPRPLPEQYGYNAEQEAKEEAENKADKLPPKQEQTNV